MCWFKLSKTKPEALIADKPIKVYKVMSSETLLLNRWQKLINFITGPKYFQSYCQDYIYKLGVLQPKVELNLKQVSYSDEAWEINKGYHSYIFKPKIPFYPIIECEIPVGTKYYKADEAIVSEQIIAKKLIK